MRERRISRFLPFLLSIASGDDAVTHFVLAALNKAASRLQPQRLSYLSIAA